MTLRWLRVTSEGLTPPRGRLAEVRPEASDRSRPLRALKEKARIPRNFLRRRLFRRKFISLMLVLVNKCDFDVAVKRCHCHRRAMAFERHSSDSGASFLCRVYVTRFTLTEQEGTFRFTRNEIKYPPTLKAGVCEHKCQVTHDLSSAE